MIEFRLCWAASSNIGFRGETEWLAWDDEDVTGDVVEQQLSGGRVDCEGLGMVLDASGFEWWVETREAE